MKTIPDNFALKEWASVVSAVAAGDQIVLVRKGGLADRNFGVQADEFLLFPTYLHERENHFKPEFAAHVARSAGRSEDDTTVEITHWCRVTSVHAIRELDRILAVSPFVIFTDETIRNRYSFRPDQAMQLIVVRAFRLSEPVWIENRRQYAGCKSWIKLADSIDIAASTPVLSDEAFVARAREIENVLAPVTSPRS
jgi:hypothetical protein